jgi:hypothetical protein
MKRKPQAPAVHIPIFAGAARGCLPFKVSQQTLAHTVEAVSVGEKPTLQNDHFEYTSLESPSFSKYDGPVASMNPPLKFVAIAFNDYGGIGFECYSTVVRPHFEELREKEEAARGSGWDARKF